MFQKFNAANLTTKFIQNIISTIYTPIVDIWKPGKSIIAGFTYVTATHIVKALQNAEEGVVTSIYDVNSDNNLSYFQLIEPYVEGRFYEGVTSNFVSGSSVYDSKTHYYLGQYLRQVRDLHGIDLMPYYNCWNYSMSDRVRLTEVTTDAGIAYRAIENNKLKDNLITLFVPVKFNQAYTLYANCNTEIKTAFIFWDGDKVISNTFLNKHSLPAFKSFFNTSYQNPQTISGIKAIGDLSTPAVLGTLLERYLTLVVQMPAIYAYSLLVIEGDTANKKLLRYIEEGKSKVGLSTYYFSESNPVNSYTSEELNALQTSPSSLTLGVSDVSYAFNDRLLEYLLWGVITPQDSIANNTIQVQENITSNACLKYNGMRHAPYTYKGAWDNDMRQFIYTLVTQTPNSNYLIDLNGFVDKDSEEIILRGKE